MPLEYTESVWRSLYGATDPETGERLTYGNKWAEVVYASKFEWVERRLDAVETQFSNRDDRPILIVGCGYGFIIDIMMQRGWTNVWGVDASPYIATTVSAEMDATVADRIIAPYTVGVDDHATITSALQDAGAPTEFELIIDDDAASSHSDAELPAFYTGLEAFKLRKPIPVVHLVTPVADSGPGDTGINWKTMAEWAATETGHIWVDARNGVLEA